ncbi:LuxR C-terminal-related transcriptional regulator [Geodermatophilus sp. SYSU D00703]
MTAVEQAHERRDTPWGPRPPEIPPLVAKLAPPLLGFAPLPRARLFDQLSAGVTNTPVTLLTGPAGAGKTVLAGSWTRAQRDLRTVAWLSLEATDADPVTFGRYLVAALARAGLEVELPRWGPAESWPGTAAVQVAAAVLASPRPVVLVLDDADRLTHRLVLDVLDLLVRHVGARLRLVLCARAAPLLPLHRYRLADRLTEIRADRLAFTAGETRKLLAGFGAPLTAEAAAAVHATTEGWVVALRLAADLLRRGVPPEHLPTSLAAAEGPVAGYLRAEVLQPLPSHVRQFLLRISVPEQLEPELAERLTGRPDSRRMLAALAAANVFVERRPAAAGAFRVHPLVRRTLAAQLAGEHPDEFAAAHHACADWYARAGCRARAAQHAIAAGDGRLAAELLVVDGAVVQLLAHGADPEHRPVPTVPAGVPGPDAAVLRAASAIAGETPPDPADLAATTAAAGHPDTDPALRAAAAVICAVTADTTDPAEQVRVAADSAEDLVAALPHERRRERGELAAVLTAARAAALLYTDADDQTLQDAQHAALQSSSAADAPRPGARCLAGLALLAALQGRLNQAAELLDRYHALCAAHRLPAADHTATAATAAAWIGAERHHLRDAQGWLAQAERAGSDVATIHPLLTVLRSRLRRTRHELTAAERAVQAVLDGPDPPRWVYEPVLDEAVRLRFARHDGAGGLQLLDRFPASSLHAVVLRATADVLGVSGGGAAPPATGAELPPAFAVENAILQTCRRLRAGDTSAAVAALDRALRLAEPERLRRPFLDTPLPLWRLLRAHPELAHAAAWLKVTPPSIPTPRQGRPVPGAVHERSALQARDPLTHRELEVLGHVAAPLSNREVADVMFLSVNTVRTHIRAIFDKLEVTSRADAVRSARALQLL